MISRIVIGLYAEGSRRGAPAAKYIQVFDRLRVRFIVPSQSIDTDQRNATARLCSTPT
jgi:hypothetical protein